MEDSVRTKRIEMRGMIKVMVFMKLSEEALRQYESSRESAMREALETARDVKLK